MFVLLRKKHLLALFALFLVVPVAAALIFLEPLAPVSGEGIPLPIIMYHNISNSSKQISEFTLLDAQFESDLKYIKSLGYETVTMTDLVNYTKGLGTLPEKPIVITFDDGFESFLVYAFPLLEKYDMKAVMSVIGEPSDRFTSTEDHHLNYSHLTWEEIQTLHQSGRVEIQNHTYNMHEAEGKRRGCRINRGEDPASYKKLFTEDIMKLQNEIMDNLDGWTPNTFAYPFGFTCKEADESLREMGFLSTLTCNGQINLITQNPDCLFDLGRYNRPTGKTSVQFFKNILK